MKIIALYQTPSFGAKLRECLDDVLDQVSILPVADFRSASRLLETETGVNLVLVSMEIVENASAYKLVEDVRRQTRAPVLLMASTESPSAMRESVINGSECYVSDSATGRALLHALVLGLVKRIVESEDETSTSCEDVSETKTCKTRLTPRQIEVLSLIQQGKSNKQIARELDLAEGTVKIHCLAIFRELDVNNRTQAAMRAGEFFSSLEKPIPHVGLLVQDNLHAG